MTQNTKLGDMIIELSDPQTPDGRREEIKRIINELGDRERIYSSWLQTGTTEPKFNKPTIDSVHWLSGPGQQYTFEMQVDLSVANNTKTFLTFDTFYSKSEKFFVDSTDKSKILVNYPGNSFAINGICTWDNNATGYRYIALEGFKADDTSLGFIGLHLFPGTATEDNSFPVSYVINFGQLANMAYMKFFVRQTCGINLSLLYVTIGAYIV